MIATMRALGWHVVKAEATLPSVRLLGFTKIVTFERDGDELAVFA